MTTQRWLVAGLVALAVGAVACDDADGDADDGGGSGGQAAGGSGGQAAGGSGGEAAGGSGGSATGGAGGAATGGSGGSAAGGAGGEATGGSGGSAPVAAGIEALVDGVQTDCPSTTAAAKSSSTVNLGAMTPVGFPLFGITISAEGGVLPGTAYDCASLTNTVTYYSPEGTIHYANSATGSCTVTFSEVGNAIGAYVRGTFSATVNSAAGDSTHELTDGSFELILIGAS